MAARFDPGLAEFIRIHEAAPMDSSTPLDVMRAKYTALARCFDQPQPPNVRAEDVMLAGPAGTVPARIYRPRAGRLPVVMYFHGGGFMLGSPDAFDSLTADLAADIDAVVVSVDYRLTPEHRFPAAFDDSLQAVRAIAARADELDLDLARLVLAGDSSGGNLAAAVAIALRDSGDVAVRGQVLIYPMLGIDFDTESCRLHADAPMLKRATAMALAGLYFPHGRKNADWRVAPLTADRLEDLPPAFITVAETDPLRDDGILYATRLAEAGVPCVLSRATGLVHSWLRARGMSTAAGNEYRRTVREMRAMVE